MEYHRMPSIRPAIARVWGWLTAPSDQHTVLGRCGCTFCEIGRYRETDR